MPAAKHPARKSREAVQHKREIFVREYVKDFNGTRAAAAAGYQANLANRQAYRLLQDPSVQAAVRSVLRGALKKVDASLERTMQEIARVAFSDVRDLFDESGKLRQPHELDDNAAASISGIDVEVNKDGDRVAKVRRVDKMAALTLLARHHKIVGDAVDSGKDALAMAERLGAARERLRRLREQQG